MLKVSDESSKSRSNSNKSPNQEENRIPFKPKNYSKIGNVSGLPPLKPLEDLEIAAKNQVVEDRLRPVILEKKLAEEKKSLGEKEETKAQSEKVDDVSDKWSNGKIDDVRQNSKDVPRSPKIQLKQKPVQEQQKKPMLKNVANESSVQISKKPQLTSVIAAKSPPVAKNAQPSPELPSSEHVKEPEQNTKKAPEPSEAITNGVPETIVTQKNLQKLSDSESGIPVDEKGFPKPEPFPLKKPMTDIPLDN